MFAAPAATGELQAAMLRLRGAGQSAPTTPQPQGAGAKENAYYRTGDLSVHHNNNQFSQMVERHDLMAIESGKLVLVMVGLPGRGKSYISRRLELFLSWLGDNVQVFNVGKYRRNFDHVETGRADFFDPGNAEAAEMRAKAAALAMHDMLEFLDGAGQVAIFDATNSQKKRRQWIWNTVKTHNPRHHVVFVESICEAANILEENMRSKVENSPDFIGMSKEQALLELRQRIANYESAYETVSNIRVSFIKLFDLSSRVMVNKIYGKLATSLVPYLMSVHIGTRPIWLVRAGASNPEPNRSAKKKRMSRCLSRMYSSPDIIYTQLLAQAAEAEGTKKPDKDAPAQPPRPYCKPQRTPSGRLVWPPESAPSHGPAAMQGAGAAGEREDGDHQEGWSYRFASLATGGEKFARALATFVMARSAEWHQDSGLSRPEMYLDTHDSPTLWLNRDQPDASARASGEPGGPTPGAAAGQALEGGAGGADALQRGEDALFPPPPEHVCKTYASTMMRATQTLAPLISAVLQEKKTMPLSASPQLNPMDLGEYWQHTWEQLDSQFPEVMSEFKASPCRFRFPGGESFNDVVRRLEPLLIEIEQQTTPVLVVSHGSTLRALYSYFSGVPIEHSLDSDFPLHTVVELTPVIGGSWIEQRFQLCPSGGGKPAQVIGPTPLTHINRA